ncbi:hypothetical protein [Aeromonas phage HJG]|nr:hypothetical protein [Aeromonas phage HJG]
MKTEIIAALNSKAITLKAAKAEHPEIAECKTIAEAVAVLEAIKAEPAKTRLDEIVSEVCQALDNIQSESIRVGLLLTEANQEFKDKGEKGAVFLDWCFNNFSIKKAQAYKLMKVAEVFGSDKVWSGVAMRVLYALATQATEEELEKAKELAANGSLTTTMLNVILAPKPEVTPTAPVIETTPEAGNASLDVVPEAPKATNQDDAPFEVDTTPAPVKAAEPASTPVSSEEADSYKAEAEALRKQVSELMQKLTELQQAQIQHNNNRQAVELPQFNSACAYAVLGLSAEEATNATLVKKAFRGLVAAGYGNGHASFEKIVAAKDALLNK